MLKKVWSAVLTALLLAIATFILMAMFFMAVLQQSYRNCPPTEEELQDNPALSIYME